MGGGGRGDRALGVYDHNLIATVRFRPQKILQSVDAMKEDTADAKRVSAQLDAFSVARYRSKLTELKLRFYASDTFHNRPRPVIKLFERTKSHQLTGIECCRERLEHFSGENLKRPTHQM